MGRLNEFITRSLLYFAISIIALNAPFASGEKINTGRVDEVKCGSEQELTNKCVIFIDSYTVGQRFALIVAIQESGVSATDDKTVSAATVRKLVQRGDAIKFSVLKEQRIRNRGRVWGINSASRREHYNRVYQININQLKEINSLQANWHRDFVCTAKEAKSQSDIVYDITIAGTIVAYDKNNYSIDRGSISFIGFWSKGDGEPWTEANHPPNLEDPLALVQYNSPSYSPRKYFGYMKFPEYRGESVFARVSLLLRQDAVAAQKSRFKGVAIMTNIADHDGGSFPLNCFLK